MVNTEIRLIIFFAAKDGKTLYSQQKQDQELWPDQELFIAKFRLKLKKVGKTTRPFRSDLNQIQIKIYVCVCVCVCVCVFKVCTLLNWSQVSVQESPCCLHTSTRFQGDQKPSYISSSGTKIEGHDGWPFKIKQTKRTSIKAKIKNKIHFLEDIIYTKAML